MTKISMWSWVLVQALACASCFRGKESFHDTDLSLLPQRLVVRDLEGASWPMEQAPRRPELSLVFGSAPDPTRDELVLLRGKATAEQLEDLARPPLRKDTEQALVPLWREARGAELVARPMVALERGGHFSVVWSTSSGQVVYPLHVSESPAAGAALVESWPAHHATNVPPNLARMLLRFDGYVRGDLEAAIALRDERGEAVSHSIEHLECTHLGLAIGDCFWVVPAQALAPNTRYLLSVGPDLSDATGSALPPINLELSTGGQPDQTPPQLRDTRCTLDETADQKVCMLASDRALTLRGEVDEPVRAELLVGTQVVGTLVTERAFALAAADLDQDVRGVLRVTDLAGHMQLHAIALSLPQDLATVSIDEVRPDPLGSEPAQEYVELLNFGDQPVQIMGFSLSNDAFEKGRSITSSLLVAAGERVLAVAPEFDPSDLSDGPLARGTRIARLDGALSLRNDGAPLFLRDASGRRLSGAPRLGPEHAGQCIVRVGVDPRSAALVDFALDADESCSPGKATEQHEP